MPLPLTVIDGVFTAPLSLLVPVLDAGGPYGFGSHERDTFVAPGGFPLTPGTYQVHGTYGVIIVVNGAIPPTWGYAEGFRSGGALSDEGVRYDNRFCQAVPLHQALSGVFVPVAYHDVHYIPYLIQWPFALNTSDRLGLYVSPGIAIDLYYLCIL
jgi:hypothetical protein